MPVDWACLSVTRSLGIGHSRTDRASVAPSRTLVVGWRGVDVHRFKGPLWEAIGGGSLLPFVGEMEPQRDDRDDSRVDEDPTARWSAEG